jgi:trans-aconitate 2-methyltransferase
MGSTAAGHRGERHTGGEAGPRSGSHRGNAILSADVQDGGNRRSLRPMTARDAWNPTQYERFRAEREQPFHDLVALITRRPAGRVVDLGCGTGLLTAALHRDLAATETLGVDSSQAMLDRARILDAPGLAFARGDISTWEPEAPVDVVFSNAALQWVGDHPALFARLATMLVPSGELAVQVPANFDHVSHTLAAEIAREEPFAEAMHGYARTFSVLPPEDYATLLHVLGFVAQSVRLQVYGHLLESTDAVVEWVRGTLLTDYESRMPAPMYEAFIARYRDRLQAALGDQRPYFYPFKRILLWGRLPG